MTVVYAQVPRAPGESGRLLLRVLEDITPVVQALPPDAALADVTGSVRYFGCDAVGIARLIRVRALAWYGLNCAVGVAANPLLARMAGQGGPPGAVRFVPDTPRDVAAFLERKPVIALYGVGPKAARTLCTYGLDSVGKVAATSEATLQRILGARLGRLVHERSHGIDRTRVTPHAAPRSAAAERRFARHEVDASVRRGALLELAVGLGRRLRADDQVARALTLTVRYADRSTTTRTRALPEPTAHTPVLAGTAQALHDALGLQRARVTALSLRAEDLMPARLSSRQLTFDRQAESADRLEQVLDRIAARWPGVVGPATLARS
ncbi:DNA polymerase Y family protein [Streptomyces laurentii]|uniref:DNA polymerase Y family protein n=1 Tax=Streptomyces laurentii TaxID=39478 RepID=UPI003409E9C2